MRLFSIAKHAEFPAVFLMGGLVIAALGPGQLVFQTELQESPDKGRRRERWRFLKPMADNQ
jgi:hypothetical protein